MKIFKGAPRSTALGLTLAATLLAGFLATAPAAAQADELPAQSCAAPTELSPEAQSALYERVNGFDSETLTSELLCLTTSGSDLRPGGTLKAGVVPIYQGTTVTAPTVNWINDRGNVVGSTAAVSDGNGGWNAEMKVTDEIAGRGVKAELGDMEVNLPLQELQAVPESWDQMCLDDPDMPNKDDCLLEAAHTDSFDRTLQLEGAYLISDAQYISYSPVSLGKVTISGESLVTKTLTSKVASSKAQRLDYQWLRNGKAIAKATGSKYTLTTSDRATKVSLRVTASTPGQTSMVQLSNSSASILGKLSAPNPRVTVPGKKINCPQWNCKATLKVTATVDKGATVKYQWYRNGATMKGQTKSTLIRQYKYSKTAKATVKYTAKVTVSRAGYKTESQLSTVSASPWVMLPH